MQTDKMNHLDGVGQGAAAVYKVSVQYTVLYIVSYHDGVGSNLILRSINCLTFAVIIITITNILIVPWRLLCCIVSFLTLFL